jgi:preprotein translocase subunit YajC
VTPLFSPSCVLAHWLLAQADAPAPGAGAGGGAGFASLMLPLVIIMALFYFMLVVPQKRREREMRTMVENLKENDRVVTIGGIHGVVTNVQRDAERVTIRVDESTGAKLKVSMSAVARVITGDESEGGEKAAK